MENWPQFPRSPVEKAGLRLVFEDDFDDAALDRRRWSPFYLPHWTAADSVAARHEIGGGSLRLSVSADQAPWCPEFDGDVRVSALQTGQFSGPVGDTRGQHRFRSGLSVRRSVPAERHYTPLYGFISIRARARMSPSDLVSLYLIGFEERPEDSGEITVFEIFGRNVFEDGVLVGHGIKAINDSRLETDFHEPKLPIDVGEWHDYAIDWSPAGVGFLLDGRRIAESAQSPSYPMQLMLTCYRLETANHPGPELEVDYVRGYERI